MSAVELGQSRAPSKALNVALWIGQLLLAAMFVMAGGMKVSNSGQFPFPTAFTYFVGIAELAGAAGLILPPLLRVKPILTPIAAGCLGLVMVLATGYHLSKAEPVGMTLGLAVLAAFVAWGRTKMAPFTSR